MKTKIIQLAIDNYESGVVYALDDWLELKDEYFISNFGFLNKKKIPIIKEESEDG
tara:strand:+ start:189 stop:353 length:165 start_codon:yes stop_codon:yes gene_type:complete